MRVNSISELSPDLQKQIRAKEAGQVVKKTATDQTIFINELPPGLNGDDGLMRMHWTKYMKLRDRWINLVRAEKPEKHAGMVNVTYTRKSVQMMDFDNISSSFKPVGDALEELNIIEDDSPNTINEFNVRWEKADSFRSQGVRIEITNVEN